VIKLKMAKVNIVSTAMWWSKLPSQPVGILSRIAKVISAKKPARTEANKNNKTRSPGFRGRIKVLSLSTWFNAPRHRLSRLPQGVVFG
jgi:hypothetical protein